MKRTNLRFCSAILSLSALCTASYAPMAIADSPKCLYISSYHKGYAWSDDIEAALRKDLLGHCTIKQFDMDTKRKKSHAEKTAAAEEAISIIESWQPDIVITSDDNAAKYIIQPHYRDSELPFVFNGVNWTVSEYGFPYKNVTGIVEIAPIEPMLKQAVSMASGKKAVYLGASTLTEVKNFQRIEALAKTMGVEMTFIEASTYEQWQEAYSDVDDYDFMVLGSNSGIKGWKDQVAADYAAKAPKMIRVTSHKWMMPVAMLGYTKVHEEHGEWAAAAAIAILNGTDPAAIPLASNRRWDLWLNEKLVNGSEVKISRRLMRRAKKVQFETQS